MIGCKFCGAPAEHTCTWPVRGRVLVQAGKIEVGMLVICGLEALPCDLVNLSLDRRFVYFRLGDGIMRSRRADEHMVVMGMRACGAVACDLHVRQPWTDIAYCQEHWNPFKSTEEECEIERARRTSGKPRSTR